MIHKKAVALVLQKNRTALPIVLRTMAAKVHRITALPIPQKKIDLSLQQRSKHSIPVMEVKASILQRSRMLLLTDQNNKRAMENPMVKIIHQKKVAVKKFQIIQCYDEIWLTLKIVFRLNLLLKNLVGSISISVHEFGAF